MYMDSHRGSYCKACGQRWYEHTSTFILGQKFLGPLGTPFSQDDIRHEPLFFGANLDFAYRRGGPITESFIEALPEGWTGPDVILDTRAHMLQPGWWPCIPGWHHDDVPRGADGQPNYDTPEYRAQHVMGLVNGDLCPTIYLKPGHVTVPVPPKGAVTYGFWHPMISELAHARGIMEAPDCTLLFFDTHTWHTGQASKGQGWRWFARATKNTTRPFHNDVRTQVNVYVPVDQLHAGW